MTAVKLNDQMTAPLRNITNAVNMMLSSWESLDSATAGGLDMGDVAAIRTQLHEATTALDQLGNEQKEFNQNVQSGAAALDGMAGKIAGLVAGYVSLQGAMSTVKSGIDYASDLAEVQNVVDVTFGKAAASVNEWSQQALETYGLNEVTAKQYVGTMGAMLKSSGVAGNSVLDMSEKIVGLAGDVASFYNLDTNTAFEKIRSGISGETEPLKQLGINMSVANLEAYALSQGITTAYDKMSQAEQTMLRYNYLMSVTSDAQGDFARTSDSWANQTRLLSENWTEFVGKMAANLLPTLTAGVSALNDVILWMSENTAFITPILGAITTAVGLYTAAVLVNAAAKGIDTIATNLKAAAEIRASNATFIATVRQYGLNKALLACPVTWIVSGIILIVTAIYLVVAAINKAKNTTISATGVVLGVLATAGAIVLNTIIGVINAAIQAVWTLFVEPFISVIEWVLNAVNGGFDSLGDAVKNLLGQMISRLLSFGKIATKIIDAVFGTNWTDKLNELQNTALSWGKNENAITISRNAPTIEKRFAYKDAWNFGYNLGQSIEEKFSAADASNTDLDALNSNVAAIAANTADTVDALQLSNEDLKMLRYIAERQEINKYTTAEIKVEMVNHNNISNEMDLDGVVNLLEAKVTEALVTSAEGVHI
nr:MAG TPA: minor tail protein [Caudoviricetes sp.]